MQFGASPDPHASLQLAVFRIDLQEATDQGKNPDLLDAFGVVAYAVDKLRRRDEPLDRPHLARMVEMISRTRTDWMYFDAQRFNALPPYQRIELLDEEPAPASPPVRLLLEVDERYRRLGGAGRLRTIAPRRFNPEGKAWLPIMHLDAAGWFITALFSNSARAHELGRTLDWVVIYYERDGHEGQATVVTETRGPLAGRRVVRGREGECVRLTKPA